MVGGEDGAVVILLASAMLDDGMSVRGESPRSAAAALK